jgi:hypothetical protein
MNEFTYAFRASAFSAERSYRLGPDALEWRDDRREGRIAYREIAKVNLSSVPMLGQTKAQGRCVLRSAGRKTLLVSASFRGLVTEDRSASYVPFVRELMLRIAAANPKASFIAGQGWGLWLFWIVILIGAVVILGGALILTILGQLPVAAGGSLFVLLLCLPIGWRVVRHGPPRPFDPRDPPADDLPG